jgi:5S rRNA maturation endonuclease (ribonuclease M5)
MDLQKLKTLLNKKAETVFKKLGMNYEILGDNIYSKCPIHEGSDNPRAFSYSIDRGIWKCWTRDCQHQYNNDIFGLIRGALSHNDGIDVGFKEALKWSCNTLNLKQASGGSYSQPKAQLEEPDEFVQLVEFLNSSIEQKDHGKIDAECNLVVPSPYFITRGFKPETLEYFEVGDCVNSKSKLYDRSIIPINDDTGEKLVALIGRSIKEYKIPKFLFSPKGFDKRYFFYNFHRAISRAKETGCLFLVEGQGDVWRLYESGVSNAMGIFGKTITREQEDKLLKMPVTHLVILTDNDQAGRESKMQIQRQLGRAFKLTFPKISTKDIGEMSIEQIKSKILPQVKGTY